MNAADFRCHLLEALVQTASDEYKENIRTAGTLDDKAQKTGATAGLFLAAGLAFIKTDNFGAAAPLNDLAGPSGLLLLAASIGLLLVSTSLSLRVMWVRLVPSPPFFNALEELTGDMLNLPEAELTLVRQENFLRDQSKGWKAPLEAQVALNGSKARNLRTSQVTLGLAIITVAILLLEMVTKAILYRLGG